MRTVQAHPGGGISVEELDHSPRDPGHGEVSIRVAFGGICGSDLHYAAHGRNGIYEVSAPLVLGHEISGVVEALGPGLEYPWSVGDPVVVHPARPTPRPGGIHGVGMHLAVGGSYLGSASTTPHTDGGFAESVIVDQTQVRKIPESLPLRRAALAEPMAVALHGIHRAQTLTDLQDKRVLVAGAGPIGCLVLLGLKGRGASEVAVTDLAAHPLTVARSLGATSTYLLGTDEPPEAESFDVIIESSGSPRSLTSAAHWIRRGGTIVQLGLLPAGTISTELAPIVSKEVALLGSQRFDVELDEAISILDSRAGADRIVSHVFDVDDAGEAFRIAADPTVSAKVLLSFADGRS